MYHILRGFSETSDCRVIKRIRRLEEVAKTLCPKDVVLCEGKVVGRVLFKTVIYMRMRTNHGTLLPWRWNLRVLCHELAHVMTPHRGHTGLFRFYEQSLCARIGLSMDVFTIGS